MALLLAGFLAAVTCAALLPQPGVTAVPAAQPGAAIKHPPPLSPTSEGQPRRVSGHAAGRIFKGLFARRDQFSHVAHLIMERQDKWAHCGGSLVHPQWVLTAAHCIIHGTKAVNVTLGGTNLDDREETSQQHQKVDRMVAHPLYDPDSPNKFLHDIALLHLPKPAHIGVHIQTIPMATRSPDVSMNGTIAGWGRTNENARTLEPRLKFVDVVTVDDIGCRLAFPGTVCVKGYDGHVCKGDSGGPFSSNGTLYGVVVGAGLSCGQDVSEVVAKVATHLDWIKKTIHHSAVVLMTQRPAR